MDKIRVHDKTFVPYLKGEAIQERIREMALEINRDLAGQNPLLISVLNGSFMFAADLMKHLTIPLEITFVKLASYEGTSTTGKVKELIGLNEHLEGRCVVVVEDIIDTGITMDNLLADLAEHKPKAVQIATLLFKPDAFIRNFPIDYCGFRIPNNFIVGYGLDYNGHGRNYPDIYTITT